MNVWDTLDEFAAVAELPAPVSSSLRSVPPSPHHPLKSRPSSLLVETATAPAPEASTSSLTSAPAAISADLRSRRTTATATATGTMQVPVDADVTRPSLKRLTDKDKHSSATVHVRAHARGAKSRTSLDELVRKEAGLAEGERDVVVHQLVKTDTIASVSLQYGITPQALRLSNRLWPSDSIHLRKVLHVPLDQCNLPSSSSIQGLSRDKDGSLVVWERERPSTQPPAQASILAPSARRATSEMGALSSGPGSYVDLLGLDSARSSMDDFREHAEPKGKGKASAPPVLLIDADDAVASYLATTNNTFSFSAPPSPPIPSSRSSPVDFFGRVTPPPPHFDPPDPPSRASSSSSSSSNPFANPARVSSMQGRKLTVSRVPISSLSYFPPPNPSFSSNRSSVSDASDSFDLGLSSHSNRRSIASGMHDIGPLTNSLSHLSIPAPLAPPTTTRNAYDPKTTVKKKASWTKRWDLSYFGAEGEGDVVEFQQADDWRLSRGAVNGARGGGAVGATGRRAVSEM